MQYQPTYDNKTLKGIEGGLVVAFIPVDPANAAYQRSLAEIAATPSLLLPADPPPVRKSLIQQVSVEDFRTTNATQATMVAWPLAQQTLYAARFTLLAIDTGNADCRVWTAKATAKRVANGASIVGAPTLETSHTDVGAAAWGVTADANGNNFRVRVTGAAGRTISWSLVGEIVRGRPDGLVD